MTTDAPSRKAEYAENVKMLKGFRSEAAKWGTVDGSLLPALDAAITALTREAEAPRGEAVANVCHVNDELMVVHLHKDLPHGTPLYTHPAPAAMTDAVRALPATWRTDALEKCNLTLSERRALRYCADTLTAALEAANG